MHGYKHWPWLEVEGTDYGKPWRWILQLDLETEKCPRVTRRIDSPGLYLYWSINRGGREGERCLYSTIKWLTLLGSWSPHAGKPISFPPPQRFLLYNTSKHLDSPKPADSLIRSIGGLKNSQNVLLMPKAMKGPTRLQILYSSHTVTARYLQCIATNDGSSLQNPACPTWVSMVEKGDNNMHLFCISFYSITTRLHRMGGGGGKVIPQEYNPPGTQSQAVGQAINLVN